MTYIYSSDAYAAAYSHVGTVKKIESLGIWVNINSIPGTTLRDAIAIYPFCFPTKPPSKVQLQEELLDLGLVSLVFVTDPFMPDTAWFDEVFDHLRVYKTHFTVEATDEIIKYSKHHRYYVRKALRYCETRVIPLSMYLDEWQSLYANLIEKQNLTGFHKFSSEYFQLIAQSSEFTMFGAFIKEELVSANIWAEHDGWVTSHLGATNAKGYSRNSSYALYDHVIRHYTGSNEINLGSTADNKQIGSNLGFFKRGFANATRDNWICGVIADIDCYKKLTQDTSTGTESFQYFPAYRCPK